MAWTVPTSRSTGDLITASIYNTDLVDNLNYLKSLADGKVALTGNETVAGVKTFSSFPVTPSSAPTTNYQTANKKYVDDYFGAEARGFAATMSADQNIANSTLTKINFNTETFDTHGEYNNSTYRYTPQRPGKYLVSAQLYFTAVGSSCYARIHKNGTLVNYGYSIPPAGQDGAPNVCAVVELNGATDYIEIYGRQTSGSTISTASIANFFQAWYLGA